MVGELKTQKMGMVSFVQWTATISVFLSASKCSSICRAQTCAHSGVEPYVKIGQGDSTEWVKKFEKNSNFSPFRDFTSIYLRND